MNYDTWFDAKVNPAGIVNGDLSIRDFGAIVHRATLQGDISDVPVTVKTLSALHDDQYTEEAKAKRKWGVTGKIIAHHDSHGLCYDVFHDDGTTGTYDPDEFIILI